MGDLKAALCERLLILDGAMGTQLPPSSCPEELLLSAPGLVAAVHERYLQAGADIIETNSFGATRPLLAEHGLADKTLEINRTAAKLARQAAQRHSTPDKPRFVAGSMGPGTRSLSLGGAITAAEVSAAHAEQAQGLIEGGADLLLLETQQDTLNIKASLRGLETCFQKLQRRVPVILSVSIEQSGAMLAGQNIEALADSMAAWGLLGLGLNCATGPDLMADHLRTLSLLWPGFTIAYPNAGLPDEQGLYGESPASFADKVSRLCRSGSLNIIGGCCGTTPEHIGAVARALKGCPPRRPPQRRRWSLAGLESLDLAACPRPILAGERANVVGSRLFKELIAKEDFAAAVEVCRRQARAGARIIDICMANPNRDEKTDMGRMMELLAPLMRVPLMIDSTDPAVVETALERCPGKCLINSVNLEGGEGRLAHIAALAQRYGAALVAGTIDEDRDQGMALTRQRKLAIARRLHELLTKKYKLPEESIFFDGLVFPAASGDEKYRASAMETIEAVRLIKSQFPRCGTILGISNVSFGLPAAGREILNAVFLHRCVEAGLDLAIVNPEKLLAYEKIPPPERLLAERLLQGEGAAEFADHFRKSSPQPRTVPRLEMTAAQRVEEAVVSASRDGLPQALAALLKTMDAPAILNGPLMKGMSRVGELFGEGRLIVAEVLQCAQIMKLAADLLEPHLPQGHQAGRATIALATVKGDVHDIGKNLVHVILKNNGYRIVDLGTKASAEQILAGVRQHQAQALGLSGLLTRSCQEMAVVAEELKQAGVEIPLVAGGAALSARFVAQKLAPQYAGPVFYAHDAMSGLSIFNALFDASKSAALLEQNNREQDGLRSQPSPAMVAASPTVPQPLPPSLNAPTPPDFDLHAIDDLDPEAVWRAVNPQMLYGKHLGVKGAVARMLDNDPKVQDLAQRVATWRNQARQQGLLKTRAVFRFFPCRTDTHMLLLYSSPLRKKEIARFSFSRPLPSMDFMALLAVSAGAGIREAASKLQDAGEYLQSHALSALALETAEAGAQVLHDRIRQLWGLGEQGARYSFGYPACPDLAQQARLLELLDSQRTVGIVLTEGDMMAPEASVSALVFSASNW